MNTRTLRGNEIIQSILDRLTRLEEILLCSQCEGTGKQQHKYLGEVRCTYCNGSGNRLDGLEE